MTTGTNTALAAESGELRSPPPADSLSTADRICAVMSEVATRVPHDAKFGYEYTTADAMYELLRPLLAKYGLVLRFNIVEWKEETITPRSGKQIRWANIKAEFSFNDDQPEVRMQGVPLYGPQGYGAAVTYMQKYWLRGKLFLATGEGDVDGMEPVSPPTQKPAQKTTPVVAVVKQAPKATPQDPLDAELREIAETKKGLQLCNAEGISYSYAAENRYLGSQKPITAKRAFIDQYNKDRAVAAQLYMARTADDGNLSEDQRKRVEALFDRSRDRFVVSPEAVALAKELDGLV